MLRPALSISKETSLTGGLTLLQNLLRNVAKKIDDGISLHDTVKQTIPDLCESNVDQFHAACDAGGSEHCMKAAEALERGISDARAVMSSLDLPQDRIFPRFTEGCNCLSQSLLVIASSTSLRILGSKAAARFMPEASGRATLGGN